MERLQLNMNALDEEKDIFVSLLTVFFSFWFVFNERHDALTAFSVSLWALLRKHHAPYQKEGHNAASALIISFTLPLVSIFIIFPNPFIIIDSVSLSLLAHFQLH